MKNLTVSAVVLAAILSGCATKQEKLVWESSATPVSVEQTADPNPFNDYGPAMSHYDGYQMAVEWQSGENEERLAKETASEELAPYVQSEEAALKLLAEVKGAYDTDPFVATKIAAVSQFVMCTKCPKMPKCRWRWTTALLSAAKESDNPYRTNFFLDQLRWCGHRREASEVRAIAKASKDKAVSSFADMVARELRSRKD